MDNYKILETAVASVIANQVIFGDNFAVISPIKRLFSETGLEVANMNNMIAVPYFLKEKKQRIEHFYEEWICRYETYDFFMHFRMSKETFSFLVEEVLKYMRENSLEQLSAYNCIPVEKGVLLSLWWLAKGDTLISCGDRFNVGISTAHGITTKFLEIMVNLRTKFIKWPNEEKAELIAEQFYQLSGYPNVIGAIAGTHFQCVVPKEQHDSYVNRKMQHTIIMQAICDSNKLLTDIFVGFPGSCNDGRVLRESPIYSKASRGSNKYFYNKYHLVGDKAYTCLEWLMTPYKDTGRLTRQQKLHNYLLSKARVLIENVFGLLKGRWRILQFINAYSIEKVVKIVVACAVLHNFCLLKKDFFEAEINISEDHFSCDSDERECRQGVYKRNTICNNL